MIRLYFHQIYYINNIFDFLVVIDRRKTHRDYVAKEPDGSRSIRPGPRCSWCSFKLSEYFNFLFDNQVFQNNL
jgi:hypothetical protein